MFEKKTPVETPELDLTIASLYSALSVKDPSSKEYSAIVDQIIKLQHLKDENRPKELSADTKATIAANLAGILLVLNYERAGIVTSKALSFISKLR